jgi:hypothetical protein
VSHARAFWSIWQGLLEHFVWASTRPGHRRFVEWVTALALCVEEHTITGSVAAPDRLADRKALERFAEYGAWGTDAVTRDLARLVAQAPGRTWHGYRASAVDDTEVHRNSERARGTCTSHEYTARCPNRATTVRAHNRVVLGALLHDPGRPAWFLPIAGRLYSRKARPPARPDAPGRRADFRTECDLAVALLRQQARTIGGPHLGICDGGYALKTVARPLARPEDGSPRIDSLTRPRRDARLHAPPPARRREGQRGPTPKWGRRRPPPRQGGRWPGPWRRGAAFIYGRKRAVRWKEVACSWRAVGHEVPVKAVAAAVGGDTKRFALVTSATELTGLQAVELFAARSRQEIDHPHHHQSDKVCGAYRSGYHRRAGAAEPGPVVPPAARAA